MDLGLVKVLYSFFTTHYKDFLGTLACCTCHVILQQSHFDRLAKPKEEELDMLDLAPELSDQSRLGCQVILTKEDKPGITVHVPSITRDARQL
jgi:hypothetical protein|uniref:Ferredoxin n=1 Tax=Panagrolaimus davidi TaxID=227884 RepID=A0A914PZL9_9BILA